MAKQENEFVRIAPKLVPLIDVARNSASIYSLLCGVASLADMPIMEQYDSIEGGPAQFTKWVPIKLKDDPCIYKQSSKVIGRELPPSEWMLYEKPINPALQDELDVLYEKAPFILSAIPSDFVVFPLYHSGLRIGASPYTVTESRTLTIKPLTLVQREAGLEKIMKY